MDDWTLQSFCFCEMIELPFFFPKVKKADGDILRNSEEHPKIDS